MMISTYQVNGDGDEGMPCKIDEMSVPCKELVNLSRVSTGKAIVDDEVAK